MKILLDNGLEIKLISLNQYNTYSNIVVGNHTEMTNKIVINNFVKLIKLQYKRDDCFFLKRKKDEKLKSFTCIAEFSYNAGNNINTSILIWFQDTMLFPIDSNVIREIKKINFSDIYFEKL